MTPQENDALNALLGQLTQVSGVVKDPQADRLIQSAAAQQPDALYLLVQRVMLLDQALGAAKQQAATLQQQLDALQAQAQAQAPAAADKSFLDANAWGNGARSAAPLRAAAQEVSVTGRPLGVPGGPGGAGAMPGNQPPYASPAQGYEAPVAPQPRGGFLSGAGGSMLGTMAATAAGVAGGAFLFQGIGSLLGNHHPAASVADSGGNAFDSNQHVSDSGHDGLAAGQGQAFADSSIDNDAGNASLDDLSGVDSGLDNFDDDSSLI
ncbi:MAG: DUF2076 domain-containing protein [Janthinobacterium lividum]